MKPKKLIIPAVLSTDIDDYKMKLAKVEGLADKVQIDVMDGRFVENKTIPLDKLGIVKTKTYLEFHMMVDAPWAYIPAVAALGGKTYIFHIEACHNEKNVHDILERIIQYKMQPSIAINPETPLKAILPYLSQLEHVLIMTVHPGKMGQKFISNALQKVRAIRKKYSNINIEVDGGINAETLPKVLKAGANYFVMGSAIYTGDAKQNISHYKKILNFRK